MSSPTSTNPFSSRRLSIFKSNKQLNAKVSGSKGTAFLIRFVHAIIALKRLLAIYREKCHGKHNGHLQKTSEHAALYNLIHKSHRAVKYASFGRSVVTINQDRIEKFRSEEIDRILNEKLKRQERLALLSRRRGGHNIKDSSAHLNLLTNLNQNAPDDKSVGLITALAKIEKSSVADRIRALKTNFPVHDSSRDIIKNKSKNIIAPTSTMVSAPQSSGQKDAAAKEIANILQKNSHIAMPISKVQELNRTAKIRNNLKNMKKMNVQEVLNYAAGTAVYFGATVALQSRHGGFLSYNNFEDIKASAPRILPSARFVVWNCDDLNDHGILRYGDAVWLQAGVHEVLGAQYGGGAISADGTRKLNPALINCRRENAFKAQQYGRWIVLHRDNPSEKLGDQVLHHDKIMLEQEWCFLASHTPSDAFMERSHSFEDSENKEGKAKPDFFKPIEECIWRLHLVTLPSDDNADARFREYLLDQAKEQIEISAEDRPKKGRILSGPLSRRISDSLRPEEVIKRHLPQMSSPDAGQVHLLKKFDKQRSKDFSKVTSNVNALRSIYGRQSIVYKHAKAAETTLKEKTSKQLQTQNEALEKSSGDKSAGPKRSLEETEDLYWDIAANVLTNTKAWESLPASMEVYEDYDQSKKEMAIRILQRFAKLKLARIFNWKRVMNNIDIKEASKLANPLLNQAYQQSPKKKSSILNDELNEEDHLSKTFITGDSSSSLHAFSSSSVPRPTLGSKYITGEMTPELSKLRQALKIDTCETNKFDQEINDQKSPNNNNHNYHNNHNNSAQSLKKSLEYFKSSQSDVRPHTAPQQQQFSDFDRMDMKHLTRQERRNLLSNASLSSVHAVNTARQMLRGSSAHTVMKVKSTDHLLTLSHDEDEAVEYINTNPDYEAELLAPKTTPDQSNHRILGKFLPKKNSNKELFKEAVNNISKSQDPSCALPKDVFQDTHYQVSVSTSLSFLRASSSSPHIYSDIKTKRRSGKNMKR